MTQVWERLFLGSLADAEDLAEANPHSVSTVITVSESPVRSKREDVLYVHIPIDEAKPVPVRRFDAVIDAVAENIRWGTVLVHCDEEARQTSPALSTTFRPVHEFREEVAA